MALSFDDRLLGEKVDNYCSSSEGEDGDSDEESGDTDQHTKGAAAEPPPEEPVPKMSTQAGYVMNTGPKGVVQDFRRYKQLEIEKRETEDLEKRALAKKLTLSCRTQAEDTKADDEEAELMELLEGIEGLDEVLEEYRQKRLLEMKRFYMELPKFDRVFSLNAGNFVEEIDKESPRVMVLVHIFENKVSACEAVNGCFECLAEEYPCVKFCRLRASDANMSTKFSKFGVPAILVYKGGELVGNLVQISKDLGEDFFAVDLESYLLEHGFLPDKTTEPASKLSSIRSALQTKDSDSDYDVD